MPEPAQVSAIIVTRGDVDLTPILEALPYGETIIWDNSRLPDWKCAGRYAALTLASKPIVYFQDDDVIFRHHTELLAGYEPGMIVANWAHGDNPAGYDDLAFVGAGAVVDRDIPWRALGRYLAVHPLDDDFLYMADLISGVLSPHKHVRLPFEIRDIAYNGERLADEPWMRSVKLKVTTRARAIRDAT